jgi:hypothetical protein
MDHAGAVVDDPTITARFGCYGNMVGSQVSCNHARPQQPPHELQAAARNFRI